MQDQLRCRECDTSPADAGDDVSPQAVACTCSICLLLGRSRRPATLPQGAQDAPVSGPENTVASTTVFRDGRAGKSGRPRVPEPEQRLKARERSRVYRARQKDSDAPAR
jgi:hypothetical protein